MSEYVIHLFEFARTGGHAEGRVHVRDLPRMVTEVPPDVPETALDETVFHWRATGFERGEPRADGGKTIKPFLQLQIDGDMWLECQRCMTPYREPLSTDAVFEIVRSEAEADARPIEDDAPEPIVGSNDFDLRSLIEEELLLALPLVPKHPVCPDVHASLVTGADGQAEPSADETSDEDGESEKQSPFAVLAALKKPPDDGTH